MFSAEVILSPALIPFYSLEGKTAVIIDILRATSSVCYALHNGALGIAPVDTPENCLSYREKGYLCAAERNGIQLEGFDMGNSPFGFEAAAVKGKHIAFTTTNGTYAIHLSLAAGQILIGSYLNIDALCQQLVEEQKDVVLVCAGWKNKVNTEDTLFAGEVISLLEGKARLACDAAALARDYYSFASGNLVETVKKSSHAQRFNNLGIKDDLEFCLQRNLTTVVPVFRNGMLTAKGV